MLGFALAWVGVFVMALLAYTVATNEADSLSFGATLGFIFLSVTLVGFGMRIKRNNER